MALRPIFYDTETTGVRPDKDRVIEIAAFDPVLNRTFEKLINPGMPIPSEATAIHHITNEMVQDAPSFAQIGVEFSQFCEGETVLIAHNNDTFDMLFLRNEYARHELSLPDWKYLDSLKWARRYRPDLPRHSLQFLREVYQIAANNAHRALDDVIVLHQVFSYMVDDLLMEDIMRLMNKPRDIQHMPFGKYQGKPLKEVPGDYVTWMASSGAFDKAENHELKQSFQKLGLLTV
jgi:DNA polymerase-3 subunit epsilon